MESKYILEQIVTPFREKFWYPAFYETKLNEYKLHTTYITHTQTDTKTV